MSKSYIKNKGVTRLLIKNNNKKDVTGIKWNINYDGNIADVDIDLKDNNKSKHYRYKLDNNDLERLLNIPPEHKPLEDRLRNDFFIEERKMPESSMFTEEIFTSPFQLDEQYPKIVENKLYLKKPKSPQVKYIVVDLPKRKSRKRLSSVIPSVQRQSLKVKKLSSSSRSSSSKSKSKTSKKQNYRKTPYPKTVRIRLGKKSSKTSKNSKSSKKSKKGFFNF